MNSLSRNDFYQRMNFILKEAYSFKIYKKENSKILMFFSFILLLPFYLLSTLITIFYYLFWALFKLMNTPLDFVLNFIHSENSKVRTGGEVIIYLFSFPFLLTYYLFLIIFIPIFALLYLLNTLLTYVWTLGGINLDLFINNQNKEVKEKSYELPFAVGVCFVLFGLILLILTCSSIFISVYLYSYFRTPLFIKYWR